MQLSNTCLQVFPYREYPYTPITSRRNDYLRTPIYDLDRAWRPVQIHSKSCLMPVERQQRGRRHHQLIIRADLLAYTFWLYFSLLESRAVPAKKRRGFTQLIRRPFRRSQPPRSPRPLRGAKFRVFALEGFLRTRTPPPLLGVVGCQVFCTHYGRTVLPRPPMWGVVGFPHAFRCC